MLTWQEILGHERIAKGIFWTKAWSLVSGCTPVSPGCAHCWLAEMAHRFPQNYPEGLTRRLTYVNPSQDIHHHPERLDLPLKTKKPQVWAIWSDLGQEAIPKDFRLKAFDRMEQAKQHLFLVVTKRPQIFLEFCIRYGIGDVNEWPKNIYLVVTAEKQAQANIRYPIALQIPAAVRIALVEPCLGPVDLTNTNGPGEIQPSWSFTGDALKFNALCDDEDHLFDAINHLDGVICGGETGPSARPMHPDWPRRLRDDCVAADVPFFFKGWGEWYPSLWLTEEQRQEFWESRGKRKDSWGVLDINGNWFPETTPWNGRQGEDSEIREYTMLRVGKKTAGRLLDGQVWEQLPK